MKMFSPWLRLLAILFVFCPLGLRAQAEISGVYLTWRADPATTMTINWISLYAGGTDNVWYRQAGGEWVLVKGTRAPLEPSGIWVRRAQLTGLSPETHYEFAIVDDVKAQGVERFTFRTMPREHVRPVTFVAGGDMMHTREMVDTMNKQAAKLDPDFALLSGDLAYANNVNATRWVDFFQSWTLHMRGKEGRLIPMVVGIGNHEVVKGYNGRRDVEASQFYTLFDLPAGKAHYVLDFGRYLSIVHLDSQHTEPIAGAQAEWLGETLAARVGQTFVFPTYHYPAYGTAKGSGEGRLPSDHPRAVEIRTQWIPHFERHGVTAVMEHDHHTYKRTHRLLGHQRDDEHGLLYLGDGAWGVRTREVPRAGDVWYLAKAEATRHVFHVTLQPSGQAQINAINDRGEIFDQVELKTPRTRPAGK